MTQPQRARELQAVPQPHVHPGCWAFPLLGRVCWALTTRTYHRLTLLLIISIHRVPIMSKNNGAAQEQLGAPPGCSETKIAAWERLCSVSSPGTHMGEQGWEHRAGGLCLCSADPVVLQSGRRPAVSASARPRGVQGVGEGAMP